MRERDLALLHVSACSLLLFVLIGPECHGRHPVAPGSNAILLFYAVHAFVAGGAVAVLLHFLPCLVSDSAWCSASRLSWQLVSWPLLSCVRMAFSVRTRSAWWLREADPG